MKHLVGNAVRVSLFLLATLVLVSCADETLQPELSGTFKETSGIKSASVSANDGTTIAYSELEPGDSSGGMGLVLTDSNNTEYMGVEVSGNGTGGITGVTTYSLVNPADGTWAVMTLGADGLPAWLTHSNGTIIGFFDYTQNSVHVTFYDKTGTPVTGAISVPIDLSEIYASAGDLVRISRSMRVDPLNWESTCSWFPGGCTHMYWVASKSFSILGCSATSAAAVTTGGLAVPLAYAVCASTMVSIGADITNMLAENPNKLVEATGYTASAEGTWTKCVYAVGTRNVLSVSSCLLGMGEGVYKTYAMCVNAGGCGANGSTPADDPGVSIYTGSISGNWSSTTCSGIAGSFVMNIASTGAITGSYGGSDSGTITGNVDNSGNFSSGSGGATGGGWSGSFARNGGDLSGSGTWSAFDCSGTWSGSGAAILQ